MFVQATFGDSDDLPRLRQEIKVVEILQLTDLCLSTEARYTRHLPKPIGTAPFKAIPAPWTIFPPGPSSFPRK